MRSKSFFPNRQRPSQSQRNDVRAKAKWPLLWRCFSDFEQAFAGWVSVVYSEINNLNLAKMNLWRSVLHSSMSLQWIGFFGTKKNSLQEKFLASSSPSSSVDFIFETVPYQRWISYAAQLRGKNMFKVREITLEQRPFGLRSSVILLTLRRFAPTGITECVRKTMKWVNFGEKDTKKTISIVSLFLGFTCHNHIYACIY